MELIFDFDHLKNRKETFLYDETGKVIFRGIYDFSYKYRTRIYSSENEENAYVEKNIVKGDVVEFFAKDGTLNGFLIKKDNGLFLEDGREYEGDISKGEVSGLLKIKEGKILIENDEELIKAIEVLFALAEIDR